MGPHFRETGYGKGLTAMDFGGLVKFIQGHVTDGLLLVVGSGLSAAEGIPGMGALATHFKDVVERSKLKKSRHRRPPVSSSSRTFHVSTKHI